MATVWLYLLLVLPLQVQDEITSEPLDTTTVRDLFTEASQKYNSVQRSESDPIFREIVTLLEAREALDEDEYFIMTESLKYLGVINFPDETETWYERLVRFDPNYELNAKDIPPKIVEVFTRLAASLIGQLKVSAIDMTSNTLVENAQLFVDGVLAGAIHGEASFSLLAGTRSLEIRKPNFDSSTTELEVRAGQESAYQGALFRNAAALVLVTSPRGVKISLNGEEKGATDGEIPIDYSRQLTVSGIPKSEAGSLVINDLEPGVYTLSFEMPCFQTRANTIEVTELKHMFVRPVTMDPAGAQLTVNTADATGGLLYLDRQRIGFLPILNHRVCPGEYELKVQFTDGQFIKQLTLADGDQLTILAEPLPSIAWFGLQENGAGKPSTDIEAELRALKSWNVRTIDPNNTSLVPINPFPILFGEDQITEEHDAALTRQIHADLYMAARVVRKVVIRNLEVAFWSPFSKRIHVAQFDFREVGKFEDLLERMDDFPPLVKPWLGIQIARLRGIPGCKVIEVNPNGPLADKVQPGAFVLSVNGNVLRNPAELTGISGAEDVVLDVDGQQLTVTPLPTIAEVSFDDEAFAPQALLARFEKLAKYHPDPLVRKGARFNQARFQFFLGDLQPAFDIFSELTLDTPYGINQGTLLFYQGLCFKRLNLIAEATESFRGVTAHPFATLFDAYGPKVAIWAGAELNAPNP